MKTRRIEVTRERCIRIQTDSRGAVCPLCNRVPDLVMMKKACQGTGVSEERVLHAFRGGVLPAWKLENGEVLVCLGCLERLKAQGSL
jgi:hypothetical protein